MSFAHDQGGAFINSEEEKERILQSCKFVDEIVHGIEYGIIKPEKYDCSYVMHGDDEVAIKWDLCTSEDQTLALKSIDDLYNNANEAPELAKKDSRMPKTVDMYGYTKATNRFKYIRRTEGISTTLMIKRFFAQKRAYEMSQANSECSTPHSFTPENAASAGFNGGHTSDEEEDIEYVNGTAHRICNFFTPKSRQGKTVVYIQGFWDLMHTGYLDIFEEIQRREAARYSWGLY